jgi:hypothetical protein
VNFSTIGKFHEPITTAGTVVELFKVIRLLDYAGAQMQT